jgi:zinc/manganese transport system substrate-binding protein
MRCVLVSAIVAATAIGFSGHAAVGAPIYIVAAENFWGEAASAVGGANVAVTSIIDNPSADPHEFEPTPSTARAIADADIIVYNGIDYDPWVDKLLAASRAPKRAVINVATLLRRKPGDNPHLWYDPAAMPALVEALVKALSADDPAESATFAANAAVYKKQLSAISDRISQLNAQFARTPVTATEPVFGYMAQALGLDMRDQSFQLAMMNDTEPSAKDTAAIEDDLRAGKVKVLFYNSQVSNDLTRRLLALAMAANIASVGVTETKPAGRSFQEWMLDELDATGKGLAGQSS